MLYALVHGLECIVDTVGKQVWVHVDEGVIHPGLVPLLPVRSCDPQVLKRLKLPS